MNILKCNFFLRHILAFIVLLSLPFSSYATDQQDVNDTLKQFEKSEDVSKLLDDAYGYAVYPTIVIVSDGLGGGYGSGLVYKGSSNTGSTGVTVFSIGFQLGANVFSQLVIFEDEAAYNEFTSGAFGVDADASASLITMGAYAQASSKVGSGAGANMGGMAPETEPALDGRSVFNLTKGGLIYKATVGGQVYSFSPSE